MKPQKFRQTFVGSVSALVRRVLIGQVPKIFDERFYLRQNKDIARSGIDPFLHYVWRGAAQNRDPAEDFDTAFFRAQSGSTRLDPVRHYLRFGANAGLDPNPSFSSASYLIRYPDIAASGVNPLLHYRTNGRREGRVASPSASKTLQIPALRGVSTRYIHHLPSEGGQLFTIKLLRRLASVEQFEYVPRLCVFLRISHDEITILVNAFEAMCGGYQSEITLEVVDVPVSSSSAALPIKTASVYARPQLDTVLLSLERCCVTRKDSTICVNYAELRLWDLRSDEARVAEIFTAGSLEFRG